MLVVVAGSFPGCFLDVPLDRIIRHVVRFCLCDHITQSAVVSRIRAAAFFDRYRKLTADLCKDLSFSCIILLFLMLNIGKF